MREEICGGLLAGLLAVGMVTATENIKDEDAFNQPMIAGFRIVRRFEKKFGSINCSELQKSRLGRAFNMTDPDDYQEFIKAGRYFKCPQVVGKAVRLIAEFIWALGGK
jgi:hypothetical protein